MYETKQNINKVFDTLQAYKQGKICEMDAITLIWQCFKRIDGKLATSLRHNKNKRNINT